MKNNVNSDWKLGFNDFIRYFQSLTEVRAVSQSSEKKTPLEMK